MSWNGLLLLGEELSGQGGLVRDGMETGSQVAGNGRCCRWDGFGEVM